MFYTLRGNKGTIITVDAAVNDHNVAVDIEWEIVHCDSPVMLKTLLSDDGYELVTSKCIDGNSQTGDQWQVAVEGDGTLTHFHMVDECQYDEHFTFEVE
jgi:hypothetical protein